MCGGASPTRKTSFTTSGDGLHVTRVTASFSAWFTLSGPSPPPPAWKDWSLENTSSRSSLRSKTLVMYSSPRSRYGTSENRTCAPFSAATMLLAIDQILRLAPSISPPIEPVVSSTKQTSIERGCAIATALEITDGSVAGGAICASAPLVKIAHARNDAQVRLLMVRLFMIRSSFIADGVDRVIDHDVDVVPQRQPLGRRWVVAQEREVIIAVEPHVLLLEVLLLLRGGVGPAVGVLVERAAVDVLHLLSVVLRDAVTLRVGRITARQPRCGLRLREVVGGLEAA